MDLIEIIKNGKNIKVETTLGDIIQLVDYVLKNHSRTNLKNDEDEIGGMELAQKVTGYARSTIYNLIGSGRFPYIKKNGRLFFSKKDLLDYIKSGKQDFIDDDITKYLK